MAKPTNTTLVTFLLDRSGSMGSIKAATIEAFNAYLDGLKAEKDINFSFLQFDSASIDTVCKNIPISDAPPLTNDTFQPRASTPLIDACVKTIQAVERAMKTRDDNPKVVICFQTDGQENCSREHTWAELNDLIKAKIALGWQFNFMGAGIDAYAQANLMGLAAAQTMSYDSADRVATRSAFSASARNTAGFASGALGSTSYTAEQKLQSGDKFDPDLKGKAKPKEPAKAIVDDVQL